MPAGIRLIACLSASLSEPGQSVASLFVCTSIAPQNTATIAAETIAAHLLPQLRLTPNLFFATI